MRVAWHIVAKDLRRLRTPLMIWVLLMVAEHVFYAAIAGVAGAPNLGWLNRVWGGSEMVLRMAALPVMAYFLIGWLIYDDSVVEKDPFWITRPISGGQLMAAKLLGVALMFVVLPVLIALPWWLVCGFEAGEIAASAGRTAVEYSLLAMVGITCAALTDGFPRYTLWTIVGLGALGMVLFIVSFFLRSATGVIVRNPVTPFIFFVSGAIVSLAVVFHQFTTRRLLRSIGLLVAGIILAMAGAIFWSFSTAKEFRPHVDPANEKIQITMAGAGRFSEDSPSRRGRPLPTVHLPLVIDGAPKNMFVTTVRASGDWSVNGTSVWNSKGSSRGAMGRPAIRRVLALPAASSSNAEELEPALSVSLPLSPVLAKRIASESSAFHGTVELAVQQGRPIVEMPLRDHTTRGGGGSYTVSNVTYSPVKADLVSSRAVRGIVMDGRVISLILTERVSEISRRRWGIAPPELRPFRFFALVKRATGEILLPDAPLGGPVAHATLDKVDVMSLKLAFTGPSTAGWLEDAVLVVICFDGGEVLKRNLDANPFSMVVEGRISSSDRH